MSHRESLLLFLVEDEALIAMDLETMVEDLGHRILGPAASVDQAIALLQSPAFRPDAAIVDANLGGQSAHPVVDALSALDIPTIIASGYEPADLKRMGLDGTSIRKPYNRTAVADALMAVLNADPDRGPGPVSQPDKLRQS